MSVTTEHMGNFCAFQFMSLQDTIVKPVMYVTFKSFSYPAHYLSDLGGLHFYLSPQKQQCAEVRFHHSSVKSIKVFFALLLLE